MNVKLVVDCVWNVMAHAQKSDFVFLRNGRVHLNRLGRQFSRLLAVEVCASVVVMLDTPCLEVVWRVLATYSIRQFSLHFPSRASPCAITFQLDSTYSDRWVVEGWPRGIWGVCGYRGTYWERSCNMNAHIVGSCALLALRDFKYPCFRGSRFSAKLTGRVSFWSPFRNYVQYLEAMHSTFLPWCCLPFVHVVF